MGLARVVRRMEGPLRTTGLGLAVAYVGFGLDFYVHEIVRAAADTESIWSPVHVPIFGGMGIAALGFLWALRRMPVAEARLPN